MINGWMYTMYLEEAKMGLGVKARDKLLKKHESSTRYRDIIRDLYRMY